MACAAAKDCSAGLCGENKKCLPTTCGDRRRTAPRATSIAADSAFPAAANKACRRAQPFGSGVCDASGECAAPACDDARPHGGRDGPRLRRKLHARSARRTSGAISTSTAPPTSVPLRRYGDIDETLPSAWLLQLREGQRRDRPRLRRSVRYEVSGRQALHRRRGLHESGLRFGAGNVPRARRARTASRTAARAIIDCGSSCPCDAGPPMFVGRRVRRATSVTRTRRSVWLPPCTDGTETATRRTWIAAVRCATKCDDGFTARATPIARPATARTIRARLRELSQRRPPTSSQWEDEVSHVGTEERAAEGEGLRCL